MLSVEEALGSQEFDPANEVCQDKAINNKLRENEDGVFVYSQPFYHGNDDKQNGSYHQTKIEVLALRRIVESLYYHFES